MTTNDFEEAKEYAISLGWKENKVQIKRILFNNKEFYKVEPYHECGCQGVIRYRPSEALNSG